MNQGREYIKLAGGKVLRRTLGRKRLIRLGRIVSDIGLDLPSNQMWFNGEREVQAFYVRHAREIGTTVFDVGARFGTWTEQLLALAEEGPSLTLEVTLFEADPITHKELVERLPHERGQHILRTVPIALSSFEGTATFTRYQALSGTNSLVDDHTPDAERVEVAVRTIDGFCTEEAIDRLGLVKIDTEGNDYEVIAGASGLLAAGQIALVQFEYNHRWIGARRVLKDVFDLVVDWPYRIGRITPNGVEYYATWSPELETYREANYLLARSDIADELPTVASWLG